MHQQRLQLPVDSVRVLLSQARRPRSRSCFVQQIVVSLEASHPQVVADMVRQCAAMVRRSICFVSSLPQLSWNTTKQTHRLAHTRRPRTRTHTHARTTEEQKVRSSKQICRPHRTCPHLSKCLAPLKLTKQSCLHIFVMCFSLVSFPEFNYPSVQNNAVFN